jgi:hypothetical protein
MDNPAYYQTGRKERIALIEDLHRNLMTAPNVAQPNPNVAQPKLKRRPSVSDVVPHHPFCRPELLHPV